MTVLEVYFLLIITYGISSFVFRDNRKLLKDTFLGNMYSFASTPLIKCDVKRIQQIYFVKQNNISIVLCIFVCINECMVLLTLGS